MAAGAKTRECEVRLKVPFHDLDPMQVVWHGHYIKYFEMAREQLMDVLGVDLKSYSINTGYLFPIVKSQVKYIHPLRHRDEFDCRARLVEANRRIVIDFEIRLAADGKLCAKGRTEQLAVRLPDLELEMNIPGDIQKALGFNE